MRTPNRLSGLGKLAALLSAIVPQALAISFNSVSPPNVDLSGLGRVAIAGDFDSISLYTYEGQNENVFSTNGSQSLLTRYPNGAFANLASSDAYIETMCPFVMKDGTLAGIIVGGNFTSLGGVQAQGVALLNPNTSQITPLPGLSGQVSSVYCDSNSSTVYFGGAFTGGNSSNAIAWTTGWTNMPFAGFNGPVTAITKAPNGNIVFAGDFDGLGNASTPKIQNAQVVNVGSANITAVGTSSESGFDEPSNIICKTGAQDGSGNTWLLADNTAGSWDAKFGFGFNPTMMRLYNTNQDGRGTKTFRFVALPLNGIMNLTYVDTNGQTQSCSAECPLPQSNTTYQDFSFVNSIGMNEFRLDILSWYGSGAGLSGIEMFQNDIYSFAVPQFNEPQCDDVSTGANATSTGPWTVTPSGSSTSDYLTAYLDSSSSISSTSVTFSPDIKQSGNYSITLYTPGCIQDNTCSTRGMVNVTGTMTSERAAISTLLYQTNDYDKYDQIYYGYVDVGSGSFRPQVTLTPASNEAIPVTVVAQRVRFELLESNGGLNGIFEYNPNEVTVSTDYSDSAIDTAGMALDGGAMVNTLAVYGQNLYVGGNFTASIDATNNINNIFSVGTGNATSLPNEGLNNAVETIYQNGSLLYVGGNFTSTGDSSVQGLNGVALFNINSNAWSALGAGVNGTVSYIVPLPLNVTANTQEEVIAVTGNFAQVNAFGQNASYSAEGIAVWVPSQGNWLHNLNGVSISLNGQLVTTTNVPGGNPLFAGSVSSQTMGLTDAVGLTGTGQTTLQSLGVNINSTDSPVSIPSLRKRATSSSSQNISGVVTGLFYASGGLNVTILGGHFSATASNGTVIENLMVLNNTGSQTITGAPSTIDSNSTFLAMDVSGSTMFAGGSVTGTADGNNINGVLVYDLKTGTVTPSQPPPLAGPSVLVNSIAAQPSSSNVYVGGSFSNAGSLNCPSLCMYSLTSSQWMTPGSGLGGTVSAMTWASNTELIIAGNLTAGGNATMMVTYDTRTSTFSSFSGANGLPGPIFALTAVNSKYNQFFVAGTSTQNNTAYLQKYDGTNWTSVSGLGTGSSIRGIQIMSASSNHDPSPLVDSDQVLLITGALNIPNFGNASAAIFNGTTFQPFLLSNTAANGQGSVSRIFVENPSNFLTPTAHYLDRGFVVLIGLAIALALIFLLVVAGILMERYRRRREGYVPMQSMRAGQHDNLGRIPPERLFGSLQEKDYAPKI